VVSPYTTLRGVRPSSIFGIFGAAATASKLLNLSEEETVNAIAFAASFASGTLECFTAGTMEWRFEVGIAVRDGIMASLIAKHGGKAALEAIEGGNGFLKVFANTTKCAKQIVNQLGDKWEIMNAGFKPYPVCALNQSPVLTMLDMVEKYNLNCDQIERIRIRVNPDSYVYPGINYKGPFNTIGTTLMSTSFCVALACIDKRVTLEGLTQYDNPKIINMVKRIEHIPDKKLSRLSCSIDVELKGWQRFEGKKVVSPDYYSFDMKEVEELIKRVGKEANVNQSKIGKIISMIRNLDKARNVKRLIDILAQCP
jgi:2-methylcitrate dehydratase PrpD